MSADQASPRETAHRQPPAALPWRWLDRFTAYRKPIGLALSGLLFALGLLACWHLLDQLDPASVSAAMHDVSPASLLGALLATAAGFAMLISYEWSACRFAGVHLPGRTVALGGFTAFAVGNAIGLSMLSGGSVRYRLYSGKGIGAAEVATMSMFASLSLGVTLPVLAAIAALIDLPDAVAALRLDESVLVAAAVATLALYAVAIGFLARRRLADRPSPDSRLYRFGKGTLRLPSTRLAVLQMLISTLDVLAAASVLYLLLPEAPPFAPFVLVYLLALAAGILSHVPGGVGVFEAILLAAFSSQLGAATLAATLVLYRLIYVALPLLLAMLVLLVGEARRFGPALSALRVASSLAAPVLAVLVFLSGGVLLISGATPAIDQRLEALGFLLPHHLIEVSHLGASLIGGLCLLLAQGLRRRLSAAWVLTLVLLLTGALLSLFKGFDWEEATLLICTAALLACFRREFYRRSRLMEVPFSPLFVVASLCVIAASVWLLLFTYQDVPYEKQLWWQFALDANAPRSLRATLGSAVLVGALALAWLLRAAPPQIHVPSEEELERARRIVKASGQPDGWLAMTGDKALLFHESGEAFLMYARRGRSMVALFDPIGNPGQRAELIWQFRDLCDLHHSRPVFYEVRAENLPFYMDTGLTALKLGEEARVDLAAFDLASKGKKDLRYTWNRAQRDGLSLEFFEAGTAPLDELGAISDAWLQSKQVREKGFSLGRFDPAYLRHFRIAVARFEGRIIAFANLLETDLREVASLDLMRVHPDAPGLSMEFLMLGLILHFKELGYRHFSLGLVPLAGLHPRRGAPLTQRLGAIVFRAGEQFYNFQGLRRFKDKFDPLWEPRYMVVPAGLDPLVAFADTAALIAGGLTGLVKR